ncbi:MAG TPA: peptidase MA family metallohydrolase [Candidatus Limnocylindrales bacterium]|nr:peptidase MA family metallohydrolase [Candidatus Limnocylindrales bacterium]
MSAPRTPRRLVRLLAAVVLATAALLPAAAPSLAADVTFGTPEASAVYGQGITFSVPMTVSGEIERLELRLIYPSALGPFVEEVPVAPGGTQSYTVDLTGSGHLAPNTTVEATWAAVPAGGGSPVLSAPVVVRYADTDQAWRTMKGDLVVVHWYAGDEAFARKALAIGDRAVKQTADLLGVAETEPIDFFIYGDNEAFRSALGPGTRENVGGRARADIRTLFALIEPSGINDSWVEVVIPHELVHLVFDTAVTNPYRFPPRWVNEGLAVYLSEGYTPTDRSYVAAAVEQDELLPLTALTGQFPTDPDKTYLAYAEAVSAIDHLVRTDGEDALYDLIGAYKDGLTDDEAFTKAAGRDVAAFQAGWLGELGAEAPDAYGPKPNPAGPLPPGWDAETPVEVAGTPRPDVETPVEGGAPGGSEMPLLVLAVAGVVIVVIVGLVVARRRTAVP